LLPERLAQLDFDEFVADMWLKNVRFGIQEAAVRAALAAPKGERVAAARDLEPTAAQDAQVVEVASELHRSDAPRQRADGTVDLKSGQVALSDKIISRDGVSGRTTGNLELMGAFEEFGDVQELRDVNGSDITVHGDVFGNIHSSGGTIILGRNLVGGKAINAK